MCNNSFITYTPYGFYASMSRQGTLLILCSYLPLYFSSSQSFPHVNGPFTMILKVFLSYVSDFTFIKVSTCNMLVILDKKDNSLLLTD